ncbi:hypothetical protein EKN06_03575 [Croceicoccus ponticola]|uniref:DNA breaking-rejoining protein n=1 Tax=Croceicoccus ponticola TaxID=2217664 RepID=A0A437H175_9SPHN|nr:hypothetical protein [Croceicoccus ponticola]RVQ69283.1 hypothetical protein EKN06_03575 [Croceicoccus ponticola]
MRIFRLLSCSVLLAAGACSPDSTDEPMLTAEAAATAAEPDLAAPAAEPAEAYVPAAQVDDIPIERVEFAAGENAITIEDSITGYEMIDYVAKFAAGQPLNVSMATQNTAAYFNILAPGEDEVAFHVGSVAGNQYKGLTTSAGDYRIRVYMMRSAARRGEKADYKLEIIAG